MKTLFKNLLALGLTTVLASGSLLAADIKERTFKFSYVQPKESHMGFGAQKFADLVSKKSGGKMTVRVFPGGTLGGAVDDAIFPVPLEVEHVRIWQAP